MQGHNQDSSKEKAIKKVNDALAKNQNMMRSKTASHRKLRKKFNSLHTENSFSGQFRTRIYLPNMMK
jgi:uncharacterized coiled-coil protein SlyX